MFDMTKFKTRYFDIKLKNGRIINIEPPKMKILKKITALSEVGDNLEEKDITSLTEAISLALSKNRQGIKITTEQIEEDYDIFEIIDLLKAYFDWVNTIQESKN